MNLLNLIFCQYLIPLQLVYSRQLISPPRSNTTYLKYIRVQIGHIPETANIEKLFSSQEKYVSHGERRRKAFTALAANSIWEYFIHWAKRTTKPKGNRSLLRTKKPGSSRVVDHIPELGIRTIHDKWLEMQPGDIASRAENILTKRLSEYKKPDIDPKLEKDLIRFSLI